MSARRGLEVGLVLVLLVGALALRLYNLTRLPLWQDEASDLYVAKELSFIANFSYQGTPHPPLFRMLGHLWFNYIGVSEFIVRLFSVIMGMGTLALLYFMARHWLNQKIALSGLLLLAVSPLHIFWSQSIRHYALLTLLVMVSMCLALLVSEKPLQNWVWVAYGVSATAVIYTHYLGFHVLLSQGIFLLVVLRKVRGSLLRLGITYMLVGVAFLPLLDTFLQSNNTAPTSYLVNLGPTQLIETIEAFSSWFIPTSYVFIIGAVFVPLYLFGLIWLWKNQFSLAILLVCWSLLPVLSSWLLSFIRPNFAIRYFIFCVPAFLLMVAVGIWRLQKPWRFAPYLLLILAVALNLSSYSNYNKNYINQDWRGLVNYIVANRQEGDFVLIDSSYRYLLKPFDYYYRYQLGSPGNLERHSLPIDYSLKYYSLNLIPPLQKTPAELIADMYRGRQRVWVVSKLNDANGVWLEPENEYNIVPPEFKRTFYRELRSTEQGTIAFALYEK